MTSKFTYVITWAYILIKKSNEFCRFTNQKEHILSGFSGTPVDDIKGDYLWFPIPEVSMRGYDFLNNVSACESGIEFKSYDDVITLNLMDPSQQWKSLIKCPRPGFRIQPLVFNGFQKYQITVNFNVTEIIITITDKQNEHCAGQLKSTECFNEHINCAMIKDDLYVIGKDKMIVIQNLDEKIIGVKGENNLSPDFEIATPHLDSTLFVVQDILFTIGGHDSHYEPFPDIYQFDHDTLSWQIHGRTTVSRYAAQVVVFKGKNEKESVFIAGGFKQVNDPCSAVESIPVEVSC